MKEVLLHIGFHKTGSTSIQSALTGYAKGSVTNAAFEEENHSIPMYTIFSEQRYHYHIWGKHGHQKADIDKRKNEYLRILTRQLKDKNFQKLIISAEDLSVLEASEIQSMSELFFKHNVKVKVFCYVRNPLSWAVSNAQERVRAGMRIIPYDNITRRRLKPFIECFGKENMYVFSFEEAEKSYGSVVGHFSATLSIDLIEPPRENKSMNAVQLALMHKLNQIPLNIWGNESRNKIWDTIKEKIAAVSSEPRPEYQEIDRRYFQSLLSDDVEEDCEWLNGEFGIVYETNKFDERLSFHDYFDEILSNSPGLIDEIFESLGVDYKTELSLENNFLNAYVILETDEHDFSGDLYLSLHPDVKAAGLNPYQHYLEWGLKEGRRIR